MSYHHAPFDPLKYLNSLRLNVRLGQNGKITLDGMKNVPGEKRRQVWQVVKEYDKLLKMQLDAPEGMRPSVRKLLAQGKIKMKDGKYVRPGNQ